MKQITNSEILRKRKSKEKENAEQRQTRLKHDRERKRNQRAKETEEQRANRLMTKRERKKRKRASENTEEHQRRISSETACKRELRILKQRQVKNLSDANESTQETDHSDNESDAQHAPPKVNIISKDEHNMLNEFHSKMDNIQYNTCPVCNERISSMTLVMGSCRRCHTEKSSPKKFSMENDMDPGDVPNKLEGLTEIEEMLIAQVFTVMTVYRLKGGQTGYRGSVINFSQDI